MILYLTLFFYLIPPTAPQADALHQDALPHALLVPTLVASDTAAWLCTGPSALRYHLHANCRGLKACSREIRPIGRAELDTLGRKVCGFCLQQP